MTVTIYKVLMGVGFALFLLLGLNVSAVSYHAGWTVDLGSPVTSSPAIVDLDNSALNGYEVVVGSSGGWVYSIYSNGSYMDNWPKSITNAKWVTSPAVGDLNGDGIKEVVAGASHLHNLNTGYVYVWHGNGSLFWSYTTGGGVESSPTLADLNGNGNLEVIVGANDNKIYAFYSDGSLYWSNTVGGRIKSTPAIGDLDSDGTQEVVFGSEDGNIYVWHGDGTLYWNNSVGTVYESSPVLGDINGDGKLEVIIASVSGLYVFSSSGSILWSNSKVKFGSSPSLGDLDGDGTLEIVLGTSAEGPDNKIYALYGNGSVMWMKQLLYSGPYFERGSSTPAIGDIDGDRDVEILVATVVDHASLGSGKLYCLRDDGSENWSEDINNVGYYSIISSPALSDLDGDGDIEVVVGSTDGNVYAFDIIVSQPTPIINASIDINPDTLNLKSNGKWITAYIELPEDLNVSDINVTTILLNETVSAEPHPTEVGDYDNDAIPDLIVKFNRETVSSLLSPADEVELTVTGELIDGTPFEGSDTIRVMGK